MLVPLEITIMFKNFINNNDLGPTKTFYAGEKPSRRYNEIEKQRLKNLTKIYKKFVLNQIESKQIKEEIEKDLQINNELSADIAKQIEDNYKHPEKAEETDIDDIQQNKKSIFSKLIE